MDMTAAGNFTKKKMYSGLLVLIIISAVGLVMCELALTPDHIDGDAIRFILNCMDSSHCVECVNVSATQTDVPGVIGVDMTNVSTGDTLAELALLSRVNIPCAPSPPSHSS